MNKIVFIGATFPEQHATAAGWRIRQIIDLFLENQEDVYFLSHGKIPESEDFKDINLFEIKLNCDSFDELIITINPTIVIFDRFIAEEQYGWRVSKNCPLAIKILDTEDLHFLRKQRQDLYLKKEITDKTKDIFQREIASILRCDLSLIISKYEYELLIEKYKISQSQLFYLPFMFDEKLPLSSTEFSNRQNFMFIGNFLHEPNWQTVLILKDVWAKLRERLPYAELHIYGAYMPDKAKSLHDEKQGFLMKGKAEHVENIFNQYKVMLAPIPFGAGLKGKLFECMIYGLPNVTNKIGAEGLELDTSWHGLIADDLAEDFIEKSVLLYENEALWQKCRVEGFKILEKHFLLSLFKAEFSSKINYLLQHLDAHREKNYMIGLLNHQTIQSTKYLSKWIEEKSKNKC